MNNIGSQIKVLDVLYPDCAYVGEPLPRVTLGTEGVCAHCGQKITVRVLCEDEHGNVFELGRTCAASQEGVHALALKTVEEKAEARRMRSLVSSPEFVAWAKSRPHPQGWARKTLLDDVQYWAGRGNWVNVRQALAAFSGTDGDSQKVSAKDQQRLDALLAMVAQADAVKAAYTAACTEAAECQKNAGAALKALKDAGASDDVIVNATLTMYAPVNPYEFSLRYSDYGASKLRATLGRAGIKAPKVLSSSELNAELRAIAAKLGVRAE